MLQGYSCVEPEILAIFGVIPLCLLFDRKKGTVCRAGLDRRVQSKCLVAELLEGAESSAHCCGFFSVTSDKNLFLVWEATPAAPEPMQAGEMKRLQLHEEKKKKSGMLGLDTSSNTQNEIWCIVVSDKQC